MEIRIANYVAASLLLEQEPNEWPAILLLDSGTEATDFLKSHARSYLILRFDDVEESRSDKQPPTKALVEQALTFAKGKDKLLVSCRAGQGRSVATAFVISCQENGTTEALKLLNPTRHRPNRLVVALGASLVDAPDVLNRFDDWRRQNAHIRLSDFYDEMEKEFEALEAQGASNKVCHR